MREMPNRYERNGLSLWRNIYSPSEEIFFPFGGKSLPLRSSKNALEKYMVFYNIDI